MGPNYQKPDVQSPDQFKSDPFKTASVDIGADARAGDTVNLAWWELFSDPVLQSLVVDALNSNKNLLVAASRIEEARAFLGFTEADMYPALDIKAGASRGNLAGTSRLDSVDNNFYIAPVLSWEIDFWGKFRRSNEAARAEMMGSVYSLKTIQISLISEVVGAYFLLLDYQQGLKISQETLASRLESLDIIQKRFSKGIIPEIDLNQAQIQKEIAAAAIPVYERLIHKAKNTLSILLGRLPGEIKTGVALYEQTLPPDVPVGLPSSLLERRPDIAQAEHLLEAQNARIGIAEASRFPAISLTGILGVASDDLSTLTSSGAAWSVGGTLVGPLFHFNKYKKQVEIEKEKTKQARFVYENTVLNAFKEVEDALNEIHTYDRQIAAVENQLAAAENAARLAKIRYDKGVTSYLEVLETERQLFSVALDLSELRREYYNAYVKLYKSLGGGWLSEEEMVEAQAPPEPESG